MTITASRKPEPESRQGRARAGPESRPRTRSPSPDWEARILAQAAALAPGSCIMHPHFSASYDPSAQVMPTAKLQQKVSSKAFKYTFCCNSKCCAVAGLLGSEPPEQGRRARDCLTGPLALAEGARAPLARSRRRSDALLPQLGLKVPDALPRRHLFNSRLGDVRKAWGSGIPQPIYLSQPRCHTTRAPPGVPHTRASLEPRTFGFSTLRLGNDGIGNYATRGRGSQRPRT